MWLPSNVKNNKQTKNRLWQHENTWGKKLLTVNHLLSCHLSAATETLIAAILDSLPPHSLSPHPASGRTALPHHEHPLITQKILQCVMNHDSGGLRIMVLNWVQQRKEDCYSTYCTLFSLQSLVIQIIHLFWLFNCLIFLFLENNMHIGIFLINYSFLFLKTKFALCVFFAGACFFMLHRSSCFWF